MERSQPVVAGVDYSRVRGVLPRAWHVFMHSLGVVCVWRGDGVRRRTKAFLVLLWEMACALFDGAMRRPTALTLLSIVETDCVCACCFVQSMPECRVLVCGSAEPGVTGAWVCARATYIFRCVVCVCRRLGKGR
jgi:hypothetical protein